MRTVLLSFFLIFIIGVGLLVTARKVRENFTNPTAAPVAPAVPAVPVAPVASAAPATLPQSTNSALLPVSTVTNVAPPPKIQINTIQRALDGTWRDENQQIWAPVNKSSSCSATVDHDMSEYIKKDEIPCWNCTL